MNFSLFLLQPFALFFIGLLGLFLNRNNVLILIMSVELALLSIDLQFLIASVYLDDRMGQLITLFILTVAAAESSIGLAILIAYYRVNGTVALEFFRLLKG
jgi:NADH-quinone oxidoreductase subunit K